MIEIIRTTKTILPDETIARTVTIVIDNGVDSYFWTVGGLPETGDLQLILDAREAELFRAAQINGDIFNSLDVRWVKYEAKQFIDDNPNALLLLELSPEDLETTIENRTANQETLLLKTLAFAVRYIYSLTKDN